MKVIDPQAFTLISTNVPETDMAEYSSGTTYPLGAQVMVVATHTIYESLEADNLGNSPPDNIGTKWAVVSATNAHLMFDEYTNTKTTNPDSIEVVLAVNRAADVFLLGVEGTEVVIQLWTEDGSEMIVEDVVDLYLTDPIILGITGYEEYCFGPPALFVNDVYRTIDALSYAARLKIIINFADDIAACAGVVVGRAESLGATLYDVDAEGLDYSRKSTDTNTGRTALVPGKNARSLSLTVRVPEGGGDYAEKRIVRLLGRPMVALGLDDGDVQMTMVYGFVQSYGHSIRRRGETLLIIKIGGLT